MSIEFVKPEDHTPQVTGWFFGFGLDGEVVSIDHANNTQEVALHYKYNKYDSLETAKSIAKTFMTDRFMIAAMLLPGVSNSLRALLNRLDVLEMPVAEEKLDVFSFEIGDGEEVYFISNYIPEMPADEKTKYEMLSDHTDCTEMHCVHSKPYEEVLDEDERRGN